VRPLADLHEVGKQLPAQAVDEEGRLAVERAAGNGMHEAADQAGRQRRLENHRAFARLQLARAEPRQGTPCGVIAHRCGVGKLPRIALRHIPVVALHVLACAGDHRAGYIVPRRGEAAHEAQAVGGNEVRGLRGNRWRLPSS
jgi:hypothetical protein